VIKNVIIEVLALLSLFPFFHALTQQLKAKQLSALFLKRERKALQQKDALETALEELRRE